MTKLPASPKPADPFPSVPMHRFSRSILSMLVVAAPAAAYSQTDNSGARPGRDPKQAIDSAYTKKILEYTTESFFLSPLVDYLPASRNIPTPKAVLGDIAGAPGKLPYAAGAHPDLPRLENGGPPRQ